MNTCSRMGSPRSITQERDRLHPASVPFHTYVRVVNRRLVPTLPHSIYLQELTHSIPCNLFSPQSPPLTLFPEKYLLKTRVLAKRGMPSITS